MDKEQLIEAIRSQNPSAAVDFLTSFTQSTLEIYLKRLTKIAGRRGRESGWVRPGDTRAIVVG